MTLNGFVRRLVRWGVKVFLLITLWSLTFNAVTAPPATLRAPGGADVVVDGARVHYERWGTRGPAVLLVHGFAESTTAWRLTAQKLASDHVVVAVDLPGYGYSQYTGRYGLDRDVSAVLGVSRGLGLHRPVLVGHSLGAAVVGEVARTSPDDIAGVIFADGDAMPPPGGGGPRVLPWVMSTPYATSIYRVVTRWSWLDERIVRAQCGSVCRGYSQDLVAQWMRPLTQGDAEDALPEMARTQMPAMSHAEVRAIRGPRGIIWGAQDAQGGGSLAGAQADLGSPRTVVLPGAGHLSMLADPQGFADAVRELSRTWR